ncbi:MAG: hypothetical protein LBT98_04120 [Puniceicoccales bacterium]|nr:hypothetical protein [Puniceicoccales bacterium]
MDQGLGALGGQEFPMAFHATTPVPGPCIQTFCTAKKIATVIIFQPMPDAILLAEAAKLFDQPLKAPKAVGDPLPISNAGSMPLPDAGSTSTIPIPEAMKAAMESPIGSLSKVHGKVSPAPNNMPIITFSVTWPGMGIGTTTFTPAFTDSLGIFLREFIAATSSSPVKGADGFDPKK